MDTNLNIPVQKKVVSVEILHLDELGYGPQGLHSRREWRKECLENLLAGEDAFKHWQEQLLLQITDEYQMADFGCILKFDKDENNTDIAELKSFLESKKDHDQKRRHSLDFVGCIFEEHLIFSDYHFLLPVIFSWVKFKNFISLDEARFNKDVDFIGTLFFKHASFHKAIFSGYIYFNNSAFDKYVNFENADVRGIAIFKKVEFLGSANFNNAIFLKATIFNETNFKSFGNFENSIFHDRASFSGAIFSSVGNFRNTVFNQQCSFDNGFNGNTQKWMQETIFQSHINFENAKFKNVGHFERVQFIKYIPSFLGVDTATTRLEFSGDSYFTKNDISEDAIKRLGSLKRLADEHGQTDQALMFNAFELRAKAKQPNAGSILKITTNLYEYLSDYGRSFAKPMLWYGVLICLSALFAMIYSTYSDIPPEEQQVLCKPLKDQPPPLKLPYGRAVVEYAMFRAGGLMDFTDTGKQNNAVNCRLFKEPIEPPLMRAWGIFKGIASIALLFLAALGLRNKYRIK